MKDPKIIALLPMKANSQRIRGKNFKNFYGRPLFRWILDTLLGIEEIERIIINTDARKLLEARGLAESARITIRDRREELCGDDVSMNLVIADDLAAVVADIYLMTHVTNPLLGADVIRDCLKVFREKQKLGLNDSLFTVTRIQARVYTADGKPVNHDPDNLVPTQDLEPCYEENSNLYVFTRESFAKTGARIGARPLMYETPELESADIDTPADWDAALMAAYAMHRLKD